MRQAMMDALAEEYAREQLDPAHEPGYADDVVAGLYSDMG
jgi:hypothetical protein